MMEATPPATLQFTARVLRHLTLWPDEATSNIQKVIGRVLIVLSLCPSATTLVTGAARRLQLGGGDNLVTLLDHAVGLGGLVAMVYMGECFARNIHHVRALVLRADDLPRQFGAEGAATQANILSDRYAKAIIAYGVAGNVCYALSPLLTAAAGRCTRLDELEARRDPCGLIVRVWYPWDMVGPVRFLIAYLLQLYTCVVISVAVLALSMAPVSLLAHAVALLRDLQVRLRASCPPGSKEYEQRRNVTFCLRYHAELIRFATDVRRAFSSMMLMHMTLTSFEISVLGFEVLMVTNRTDSLRFGMHLLGWLMLLLLVCGYGQSLIDESTAVAYAVYETAWYETPPDVQRDLRLLMLRAQRPLTLSAASLGVMSLETFLGILSTAYSYFTLLLNLKNN